MIDLEWLRRLIDMVEESNIDSLEVSRFATRVKIAKSPPVASGGGSAAGTPRAVTGAPIPAPAGAGGGGNSPEPPTAMSGSSGGSATAEAPPDSDLHDVTSPMVGTFYRAPAPDAPSYVEVGDRVRQGQTLCILEAMKLMNELESEVAGVVREVAVQNAEPVEYGQLLFRIELDGAS